MTHGKRFRLKASVRAIDDARVIVVIYPGEIVEVLLLDNNNETAILRWDDRTITMLASDLIEHGAEVAEYLSDRGTETEEHQTYWLTRSQTHGTPS